MEQRACGDCWWLVVGCSCLTADFYNVFLWGQVTHTRDFCQVHLVYACGYVAPGGNLPTYMIGVSVCVVGVGVCMWVCCPRGQLTHTHDFCQVHLVYVCGYVAPGGNIPTYIIGVRVCAVGVSVCMRVCCPWGQLTHIHAWC